jgi:hypothetical protein
MKNSKLIVTITVAIIVICIWIFRSNLIQSIDKSSDQTKKKVTLPQKKSTQSIFKEDVEVDRDNEVVEDSPYQLKAVKISYTPIARNIVLKKNSAYRFYGSGGRGRILNTDDEVIMETDIENELFMFNINLSPDQKKVLIYRGGISYDIFDPVSIDSISLPEKPSGANMLGFHSWDWIDNTKLLGIAYEQATLPESNNKTKCGCEGPRLVGSVLYIYDLNTQQMSAVNLPRNFGERILLVNEVDSTGKIQIGSEDHTTHRDSVLGWFELE